MYHAIIFLTEDRSPSVPMSAELMWFELNSICSVHHSEYVLLGPHVQSVASCIIANTTLISISYISSPRLRKTDVQMHGEIMVSISALLSSARKCGGFTRRRCPCVCLFVCSFVCRMWSLLSHLLRGSTWRRLGAYRIVSDTLVKLGEISLNIW